MNACATLIDLVPDNLHYKSLFIKTLTGVAVGLESDLAKHAFIECLRDDRIQCVAAIDAWFTTVTTDPSFKSVFQKLTEANAESCADLLKTNDVTTALNASFICLGVEQLIHPAAILETAFVKVRRAVLTNRDLLPSLTPFVCAMAHQMFMTEYVGLETQSETEALAEMLEDLNHGAPLGLDTDGLLIFSCYRSLRLVKSLTEAHGSYTEDPK